MRVTVNIPDELAAQVIADGSSLESYVERLVVETAASMQGGMIRPKHRTREAINASLDRLAQFSDKLPYLSD